MKHFIFPAIIALILGLVLASCTKSSYMEPVVTPEMDYTDLANVEVSQGSVKSVDIDGNGSSDFVFNVILVGDPILQRDRLQFYANSKVKTNLMVDELEQTPLLEKNALISLNPAGHQWFEISAIVLAEKISTVAGAIYWDGLWKNANHHYLGVQVEKEGKIFQGWIELSFNQAAQKLVLHRAAISREPGKTIRAGK